MLFNHERSRPFRFGLAIFLALLITVPVFTRSAYLQFIDVSVTGDVQEHETMLLHLWYVCIAFIGNPKVGIFWILLIAFLLWGFKYKIQAFWAMGTVFSGDFVDEVIKHLVRRPRPALHPAADTGFSFPSSHVFSTFLIVCVLWFVVIPQIKRNRDRLIAEVGCWAVVILVMLSRIYLNAHYPSDTLGALVYGYAWLQVCEWLYIGLAPHLKNVRLTSHSYL